MYLLFTPTSRDLRELSVIVLMLTTMSHDNWEGDYWCEARTLLCFIRSPNRERENNRDFPWRKWIESGRSVDGASCNGCKYLSPSDPLNWGKFWLIALVPGFLHIITLGHSYIIPQPSIITANPASTSQLENSCQILYHPRIQWVRTMLTKLGM